MKKRNAKVYKSNLLTDVAKGAGPGLNATGHFASTVQKEAQEKSAQFPLVDSDAVTQDTRRNYYRQRRKRNKKQRGSEKKGNIKRRKRVKRRERGKIDH